MFGIGMGEIIVLLIVALLVFGPDRLPEMTKQAASFLRDLRRMVANARRDIQVSARDLGINEEDLDTLRQLRNPKAFVRDNVLDGIDVDELTDLGLDGDDAGGRNGGARNRPSGSRPTGQAATSGRSGSTSQSGAGGGSGSQPAAADPPYDPDAT